MPNWPNILTGITAGALGASFSVYAAVTMATASITQAAPAVAPTWARYLMAWSAAAFRVNFGAPTTSATGVHLPADTPILFPIGPSTGDLTVYVESATTLSIAHLSYMADL